MAGVKTAPGQEPSAGRNPPIRAPRALVRNLRAEHRLGIPKRITRGLDKTSACTSESENIKSPVKAAKMLNAAYVTRE